MRQESQGLSREKEILQLRKGETADDMEKHMKEIRKELEEVDADNRKLREKAFKTGGDMVSVRVTEDDFRVKQEENRALKHEIADLKAKVEQLQASVDEAERGEQGSVKIMEQNLSTLDREAQQLHLPPADLDPPGLHAGGGRDGAAHARGVEAAEQREGELHPAVGERVGGGQRVAQVGPRLDPGRVQRPQQRVRVFLRGERRRVRLAGHLVHRDERWVRYRAGSGRIELTSLYEWYAGDFEQVAGSVLDYVARYREDLAEDLRGEAPRVSYLSYDWSLNGE